MPLELVERTLARHAPRRPGQRLRADRDQLDHRHARPPTTTARPSPARPGRAGAGSARSAALSRPSRSRCAATTRRPVPAGEKGEIWVRGEQVAGEYVGSTVLDRRTAGSAPATRGWFDEHGFLYVEGRLDDVIVRGRGEHLARARSKRCSWPTPPWPRPPSSASPTPSGARRWPPSSSCTRAPRSPKTSCRTGSGPRLRSTKMPGVIEFRDELPYSPTGKLLRRVLRDELAEGVERGVVGRART